MDNDPLNTTFAALADPTRRAILERLAHGDATVGELAEPFAMTLPAISKHLSVLERAGLIVKSRDGQRRHCRITTTPLKNATAWLDDYRRHWEANLDSLDTYLSKIQNQEK
ncbi:MAG TPA: metalloregulator ArsR/SmtB family transcription factor [Pedococcus sp.]|jgi:DNA-binding transcriptional ArsR family regulator|nr:metalloregulator ArsR/SmtB family transcription factor [Pedococcus sp.]